MSLLPSEDMAFALVSPYVTV